MIDSLIRILLVEDNRADLKLIELELRRSGLQFQATHVENESDFLRAIGTPFDAGPFDVVPFDVVLSDWTLPQFDCLRALAMVRERDPNLPFIIVSGSIGEEAAVQAIKLGANDYLIKDRLGRLAVSIQQSLIQRDHKVSAENALKSLKTREFQLAEAQQVARMGSWVWNPNLGEVWWSDAMYLLFGVVRSQSKPSFDLFLSLLHPDDRSTAITRVEAMLAGKDSFQNDFRVIRPDGASIWIHSRARATRNAFGEITSVDGIDQDITERKEAEAKILASEERLKMAIRATNDAIWDIDLHSGFVEWNEQYADLLGRPLDTANSWSWWIDKVHPLDRDGVQQSLSAAIESRSEHWECRYRIQRVDGVWAEIYDRAYIARDENGKATRVVGAMQDITDRISAESKLRRANHLLQSVLGSVTDSILTISATGSIQMANSATEIMFQRNSEELQNCNVASLIAESYREQHQEYFERVANGVSEGGDIREYAGIRGDGSTFPIEVGISGFEIEGEKYFTEVVHDVSERKKLQQKLYQAQKMEAIGRLAGGIAHDFNNLLTVIMGYSELLLAKFDKNVPDIESLRQIHEAGRRAAQLTAQLLAFGRKSIVKTKVLNLNNLIENLSKMLRPLIGEDIDLVLQLAPNLHSIEADSGQMEQVLVNLVVNARDAMPSGGKLTIATRVVSQLEKSKGMNAIEPGSYVQLCVTDTGCGMPAEVLDQVFEPFYTTKDVGQGTGLGLATTYGIVDHAGGTIEVQSEVGVGTTFSIYLPAIASRPISSTSNLDTITGPRGAETILLVEDEAQVLQLVRTILESQGYLVHAASGKIQAIEIATNFPGKIELLITDVVMPNLSGRDLAEIVRQLRPNIRVLFMSGYTDDAVLRYGVESGSSSFLQKPITSTELARKVREMLDMQH